MSSNIKMFTMLFHPNLYSQYRARARQYGWTLASVIRMLLHSWYLGDIEIKAKGKVK